MLYSKKKIMNKEIATTIRNIQAKRTINQGNNFIIILSFNYDLGVHTLVLTTDHCGAVLAEYVSQSEMLLLLRYMNNQGIIYGPTGEYAHLVESVINKKMIVHQTSLN